MRIVPTICSLFVLSFELSGQIVNPRGISYNWETDTTIANIDLSEIRVIVATNTFPSLNYPAFIGKQESLLSFFEHEPVISVSINGKAKAYPLNMLIMHEMSNDRLGGMSFMSWGLI